MATWKVETPPTPEPVRRLKVGGVLNGAYAVVRDKSIIVSLSVIERIEYRDETALIVDLLDSAQAYLNELRQSVLEAADEESERRKEAHEDKGSPPAPGNERG